MRHIISAVLISGLSFVFVIGEVGAEPNNQDYLDQIAPLDLPGLMNQEITSVMRKEQTVSSAPAAVYVITAEDIQRSSANNIPDLLRVVPGITVVQTNANSWTVTSRGFDSDGSAKLLVLIDGRSVYSPLFSGVFWDVQNVVLADIERIEVIRGPGAVTWGSNAVNGVINIITKKAKDTQGGLLVGGGGKQETGFGTVQYGGQAGPDTYYRLYGNYFKRDSFKDVEGSSALDGWNMGQGGFRMDSQLSEKNAATFQGDMYNVNAGDKVNLLQSFAAPFSSDVQEHNNLNGGNLLFRFTRDIREGSQLEIQTYYDQTNRSTDLYGERLSKFDLDIKHHLRLSPRHDVVYGAKYSMSNDDLRNSFAAQFSPQHRLLRGGNAFVQDEITIVPDTFKIIPGIKVGPNSLSGFEYQPAIKTSWTPDPTQTIWSSISRAVRVPARIDQDLQVFGVPTVGSDGRPVSSALFGNPDFKAEDLLAYEIGYRVEPVREFSLEISPFYHHYSNLLSIIQQPSFVTDSPSPEHVIAPFTIMNGLRGDTFGVEFSSTWKASDIMTFKGSYSFTSVSLSPDPGLPTISPGLERETPYNQASLQGHLNLPWNLEFDPTIYYVDSIPAFDVSSHIRGDIRLGWKATSALTVEFIAQNLLQGPHREFNGQVEIEPSYFGRITYRFQ